MKVLKDILFGVPLTTVKGTMETKVSYLTFDSRTATESSLFIAISCSITDGHDYISKAYENGCRSFLVQDMQFVVGVWHVNLLP